MSEQPIKLLFITKDWSKGIERNNYFLSKHLEKLTHLTIWKEPGHILEIVKQLEEEPDFILINDLRPSRSPKISGLGECSIPVGAIMHDLHDNLENRKEWVKKNNIRFLFTHYRDAFLRYFPEYRDRMIWFPHFINQEVFKDYQQNKEYDYLLMGNTVGGFYPLRRKVEERMKNIPGFVQHAHPGYDHKNYNEKDFFVGHRYAEEINKAKIFFTCDSIFHYSLMKYFETLACKTLLLAPYLKELEDIGFIPNVHYIPITEDDFFQKAIYYNKNYETIGKQIALNGFKMVHEKHTLHVRAKELVNEIERILEQRDHLN